MRGTDVYRVTVKTADFGEAIAYNMETEQTHEVLEGVAFVQTKNPEQIYKLFGPGVVLDIQRIGVGYTIKGGVTS
jgi:hypothetical protein